jgi:acyl transferase domain-containing protein
MAYLKDHKVDQMVIFPAAGFVDIVLEAGVQLFEGRPFVVEDFEIRKPLILPESPVGLQLEIAYDSAERTFAIQSRFENGPAWSLHVVGSIRGERTESSFSSTAWNDAEARRHTPVEVTGFYGYMSDMGLRYGTQFQPIRELFASSGESAGRVTLSEEISNRAGEYPLHPVLFDGALQVFSAGAATVEDRKARLKLPVRFSRILFLRSPGAAIHVKTAVLECNEEFSKGRLGPIRRRRASPCVLVDGFRAISVSGARRSGAPGGTRDVVYHVGWERTPTESQRAEERPLRLAAFARGGGTGTERCTRCAWAGSTPRLDVCGGRSRGIAACPRITSDARGAQFRYRIHRRLPAYRAADAEGLHAPGGEPDETRAAG